jgi:hypothetical protein
MKYYSPIKHLCLGLIFLLNSHLVLKAQDDCATTLSKAQKLYESGNIEGVPQLLESCLSNGFTSQEKIQAQKLIILSYLFSNRRDDADKEMLSFLKRNPEYTPATNDQAEFLQLLHDYINTPFATIGFSGGVTLPSVAVIRRYGVDNLNENQGTYSATLGFHAGMSYTRRLTEKFALGADIQYAQYGFDYEQRNMFGFTSLTATESHKSLSIPVSVIYNLPNVWKLEPYGRAGFSVNYLLKVTQQFQRSYTDNVDKALTSSDNDISTHRNTVNVSGVLGCGFKYHVPHAYIFTEFRLNAGMLNLVKPSGRYAFQDNTFNYYYSDNDFRLNTWQLSIGYAYIFYDPKKKK